MGEGATSEGKNTCISTGAKTEKPNETYFIKSEKLSALMEGIETLTLASGSVNRFSQYREGEGRKSGVKGVENVREKDLVVEERFAFSGGILGRQGCEAQDIEGASGPPEEAD